MFNNLLPAKYKPLVIPVVALAVVVTIAIIGIPTLYGQITQAMGVVNEAQERSKVLSQKVEILENARNTPAFESLSEDVAVALPQENPSLMALAQVRRLAEEEGLALGSIKSGGAAASDASSVLISFEVIGPLASIRNFIDKLDTAAPLLKLSKTQMAVEDDLSTSRASVETYWSALPKKLPEVDQPVDTLTEAERSSLNEVAQLDKPEFAQGVVITGSSGRTNPFSL